MQIDLRSDTVTRPSKGMLDAMRTAKLGDDVYAEDPTVNALEARVAALFGKPKALFFPSGTMANQTAIKLHTQPGEQLICDKYAHVYNYEGGGVSFNSGVSCQLVDGHRGMMTAAQVEAAINPPDFYHSPLISLVTLENTTNKGGGACWDFNEISKIRTVCDAHELGLHLDGARLWNALVAKPESALQYGQVFDTISVCFSKGLGAPVGSMLVGDEDLLNKALRVRKMLGGGMRQIGSLAAAASYALDHQYDRLKDDHQKAKDIAEVLQQLEAVSSVEPVETNIVIFKLNPNIPEALFLDNLKAHDILVSDMGSGKLRMVTHLDYTDAMHANLLEILRKP
ncbi:threonine aldolase family protein [Formosa sp. Hel1_33_131]|uniref:threonine aldolase family protein n=1 Tax=Formosa sp. Hel1_33_131 TaxID=1336794 RepID=UPI00084E1875|nr:GntG family PLP-dependent aldolase [Formosa sp. Hel1_33_131]